MMGGVHVHNETFAHISCYVNIHVGFVVSIAHLFNDICHISVFYDCPHRYRQPHKYTCIKRMYSAFIQTHRPRAVSYDCSYRYMCHVQV